MSLAGTFNMPTMIAGDTWPGVSSITITPSSADLFGTLSSVRAQFRATPAATEVAMTLSTTDDSIEIVEDASTGWEIAIPEQNPTIAAGTYYYDMEFTDSNSNVYTLLRGRWVVQQDITQ